MPQRLWVCDRCKQSYPLTASQYEIIVLPSDGASRTYWLCAACWERARAVLTSR
jgi:hypothetical protein